MAMDSDVMATKIVEDMRTAGLFSIPSGSEEQEEIAYNLALANFKIICNAMVNHLTEFTEVIDVKTSVTTSVQTVGTATAQTGSGQGSGTQNNTELSPARIK